MKEIPQLYLYKQDKRTCLGEITAYTEMTEDIRFNACSELSFTITDKFYDTEREKWIDNPMYDKVEKHRLLYFNDNTNYFEFPSRRIGDSSFYGYKSGKMVPRTVPSSANDWAVPDLRYDQNPNLKNFTVQKEVELFDIGLGAGRNLEYGYYIVDEEFDKSKNNEFGGSIQEMGSVVACRDFIPVKSTDVVAYQTNRYNGNPEFGWHVAAYSDDDVDSYIYDSSHSWYTTRIGSSRLNLADKITDDGFVRFWFHLPLGHERRPWVNWCKVYSGERRCTSINNLPDDGTKHCPKLKWFKIVSTDEECDGISRLKKVTAYSYEYSLRDTTFSLSEGILPLYIPDAILNLVNGDYWIRDCVGDNVWRSRQLMRRGILNELLDYLPDWKIGHVSSKLMTTYRTINDVDNLNIYSFLMDNIQSTYNCFIVFDNENMTISAYSLEDINNLKSNLYLSWDSAIKSFQKDNVDASYFTAIRVRAGDDQYGLGLVNPTGSGMVYNLNRIAPDLNYSLDAAPDNFKRPLSEAVAEWMGYYTGQIKTPNNESMLSNYQYIARRLVKANKKMTEAESRKKIALGEYYSIWDKINVMRQTVNMTKLEIEKPWSAQYIKNRPESTFYSSSYKSQVYDAALVYEAACQSYDDAKSEFLGAKASMDRYAKRLTLDSAQALKFNGNRWYAHGYKYGYTVLSAAEIQEIRKYIVEGVWTYEDAAFSDTYDEDDIIDMLNEVFKEAKYDLANRLAIANFDFTIDSANVMAIPEFDIDNRKMYMGHQVYLNVEGEEKIISPMLLVMHVNYKDPNDFSFTFTTDAKRKPEQFRYADLYGTITQTSVTDSSFTFDT